MCLSIQYFVINCFFFFKLQVCKAIINHFRADLEKLLRDRYRKGQVLEDPYELVKSFCIDGGTQACADGNIPSITRKNDEMKKLKEL